MDQLTNGVYAEQPHQGHPGPGRVWDCLMRYTRTGQRVLEAGCGSGYTSNALAALGYRVVAVDPVVPVDAQGGHRLLRDDVLYVQASVPWGEESKNEGWQGVEPGTFDAVVAQAMLMHIPAHEFDAAMCDLCALLGKGGILLTSTCRNVPAHLGRVRATVLDAHSYRDERGALYVERSPQEMQLSFVRQGLRVLEVHEAEPDLLGREGIVWDTLVGELL